MTIRERAVTVKQVPEILDMKHEQIFLGEIQSVMNMERPCVVLDCSNTRQLDRSTVHLLLCCLEEAMKRNGDVKLAALPPGAGEILEQTGAGRIFDIYATTAEAVSSYRRLPTGTISQTPAPGHSQHKPERLTSS